MALTQNQLAARTRMNSGMGTIGAKIKTAQEAYFLVHGRYCQLSETIPSPKLGTTVSPRKNHRFSDENADWDSLNIKLPGSMDYSLRVDTYKSPTEDGYTLTATTVDAGVKGQRAKLEKGTETKRVHSWQEVIEDEI